MEHFAKIAHQVARSEYFDYLKSKFPFQSMIVGVSLALKKLLGGGGGAAPRTTFICYSADMCS